VVSYSYANIIKYIWSSE